MASTPLFVHPISEARLGRLLRRALFGSPRQAARLAPLLTHDRIVARVAKAAAAQKSVEAGSAA